MKNQIKRSLLAALLLIFLLTPALAMAASASMPKDANKVTMQVFSPTEIVTIAAAGDVTVSGYRVIMFDNDVTIYFGSDTTDTYLWPANQPMGTTGLTTIHVDAACKMLVM